MLKTIHARSNFLYAILAIIIFVLFFLVDKLMESNTKNDELNRQYVVIQGLNTLLAFGVNDINYYLSEVNYKQVDDESKALKIINDSKDIIENQSIHKHIKLYNYDDKYYIQHISNDGFKLYEDLHHISHNKIILLITFLICELILFAMYKNTINILKWLNGFYKYLKKWSHKELQNDFIYEKDDEIGILVKEFNKATNRIDELILSRQFFLRAIMHELKTPIGKGMILLDLPENEKNKQILKQIFERLRLLVDEFGKIEKVLSKNHEISSKEYSYSILLEQTKDIMFLNDDDNLEVILNNDEIICVDMELFTLLLKNLIDNALKYSDDNKCIVIFTENEIIVKNKASKLEYDIAEYFKPFTRGNNTKPGLGLGLYLIKYICDIHKFNLKYNYENNFHIFRVEI